MRCTACGVYAEFEDGFCAACGMEQLSSRLPAKRETPSLPAIWREAAPAVARGAALVAAGVAAEFLLRSMARGAISAPSLRQRAKALAPRETTFVEEIITVSHTEITRRLISRR